MKCKLCEQFYKEYPLKNGKHILYSGKPSIRMDEVKCAFQDGTFGDNWNCQTMEKLRDIAQTQRHEDTSIGIIPLPHEPSYLVMLWYKDRGRTNIAYIMDDGGIEPLTLKIAERIIYENNAQDNN